MELREEIYLTEGFNSLDDLRREVEFWDATSAQWLADCPRRGQYSLENRAVPLDESHAMRAGTALHAGLAVLYSGGGDELALQTVLDTWGQAPEWRLPPGHKYSHLHSGHLEVIFKNYLEWKTKHDSFRPLVVTREELDLTDVLAAIWLVTPDGKVVLGESKLVMRFSIETLDGLVNFIYAGRPDLPIEMGGVTYILDHKSTNAYLSSYYFDQYRFSNQLRGYGAMISKILKRTISGALINGIYMGERASLSEFKGEKFARFGPMSFMPAHLNEAIKNQYYWRKSLDFWKSQGYFPQHTGKLCSGCSFADLCNASPSSRPHVLATQYGISKKEFLTL
jgi:PD-(D/E)XK nuclease superfamily protein